MMLDSYKTLSVDDSTKHPILQPIHILTLNKNFLFSRMSMSKKDKRPSSSFSNEKFMLVCLEDKYFLDFST